MKNIPTNFTYKPLIMLVSLAMVCLFALPNPAAAQRIGTIDPGTTIYVRTIDDINASKDDGRVFPGVVDQDVVNRNGRIAIPKGSDVELVVRKISEDEVSLDLDSVMINGQRFGIEAEQNVLDSQRKDGIGTNKRTGKYVGGGAVIGAIIGGITGGGKGAAIGAGAGAAAGAGAQILTRGKSVRVPSESLLTFRLSQPLRAGIVDEGYSSNGIHYHSAQNQGTYRAGLQKPGHYSDGRGTVSIGYDKNISWNGPENATVYVQVDNEYPKLFAAGRSGSQAAPWITQGHVYTFVLRDGNGVELASDQRDLRYRNRR